MSNTVQVTLNVDAPSLAPTLQEVFGAMTPEQKSKLAAEIAYRTFTRMLAQPVPSYGWGGPKIDKADEYFASLAGEVRKEVARRLTDVPELNARIETVLDLIRPHLAEFVRHAVTAVVAGKVAEALNDLTSIRHDLDNVRGELTEKLRRLGDAS